jgi:FtsH-binding integral membrane protein
MASLIALQRVSYHNNWTLKNALYAVFIT